MGLSVLLTNSLRPLSSAWPRSGRSDAGRCWCCGQGHGRHCFQFRVVAGGRVALVRRRGSVSGRPELKMAEASLSSPEIRSGSRLPRWSAKKGRARSEGEYNTTTRTLDATISGQGLRLLSRAAVPLVTRFQGGTLELPNCSTRKPITCRAFGQAASTFAIRRRVCPGCRKSRRSGPPDRNRWRRFEGTADACERRRHRTVRQLHLHPGRSATAQVRLHGSESRVERGGASVGAGAAPRRRVLRANASTATRGVTRLAAAPES